MTDVARPGWYPDPTDAGYEHWWDGSAYTQTRQVQPSAPPPYTSAGTAMAASTPAQLVAAGISPKSRTVASILGFFLGGIGIHRFYLGNIGMAIAMLFLGWLTLGIWPLIDWILVLAGSAHDGQGLAVVNWS